MQLNSDLYTAVFYAEGMGPGLPNIAFGQLNGALMPAGGPYTLNQNIPGGIPNQGVYRCGVYVVFSDSGTGNPLYGWGGFNEDCAILVHPFEEWPP